MKEVEQTKATGFELPTVTCSLNEWQLNPHGAAFYCVSLIQD